MLSATLSATLWVSGCAASWAIAVPIETSRTILAQADAPDATPDATPDVAGDRVELRLIDAVALALQNNREIENAYLERLLEQEVLNSAEAKFAPDFIPEINVSLDRDRFGELSRSRDALRLSTRVSVQIPTGASLEASVGTGTTPPLDAEGDALFPVEAVTQDVEVSLTQPLLRGAGSAVNRASVEIARLNDATNYVALQDTLATTITNTVLAYRRLLQAQEALEIQELALDSARTQVEVTQALVEGGRRARVDLVTPETQVANREVDVLQAQNRLVAAQLELLRLLDLDREIVPVAAESPEIPPFDRDRLRVERLLAIALSNNPAYVFLKLERERRSLRLLLAEDDRRWQLDLEARYRQNWQDFSDDNGEWRAGLVLRQEFFGDERRDLAVSQLETSLLTLDNQLENARDDLAIDIRDAVRDIEARFQQVQLARRAQELSQEQLDNEREKLRLGVGDTRLIDIVNFENDLVNAENAELAAEIAYLNALTRLDRLVGTTLSNWNVAIERDRRLEPSPESEAEVEMETEVEGESEADVAPTEDPSPNR